MVKLARSCYSSIEMKETGQDVFEKISGKEAGSGRFAVSFSEACADDEDDLKAESAAGAAVVDLRHGVDFAEGHFPGSLNVGLARARVRSLSWYFLIEAGSDFSRRRSSEASTSRATSNCLALGLPR